MLDGAKFVAGIVASILGTAAMLFLIVIALVAAIHFVQAFAVYCRHERDVFTESIEPPLSSEIPQ